MPRKFHLGMRQNFFPAQGASPEQIVQRGCESPSVETFQSHLDPALCSGMTLLEQGGGDEAPLLLSSLTHRVASRRWQWEAGTAPACPCSAHPSPVSLPLNPPAVLWKRAAPLGPMPNADLDVGKLAALERYRSFARYLRQAEREGRRARWWNSYRKHTDPPAEPPTDIGLPRERLSRAKEMKERKRILRENHRNAEMERAARLRTVLIPLDEVRAEWERTSGPFHKQRVAKHCGVFRDLFRGATFTPWVALSVHYSQQDEHLVPVYYGNMVTPSEASSPPAVSYEADKGSLWTLLLTNPDGHLRDTDSEYLHWLVTNIPGSDIKAGKETCHYLPPFPAMGTGYHRFIFLLFKQQGPIDFSQDARPTPCYSLKMRTFSTFDFYRKHKDAITPAGLAFFQCQWDSSVTSTFHQLLNMREPVFEFVRPPTYHPPQVKFPRHQPLRYLDRYRDTEEPTYGIY